MAQTCINWFRFSSGVILTFTAIAKVWSGLGIAHILQTEDPITGLQFGHLILAVGILEMAIASVCFFSKSQTLPTILLAWLATSFLAYRLGLWSVGWQRPCACLGNLSDAIHISPQTADTAMKFILAYLLLGSYASLFWLWRQSKRASPSASAQWDGVVPLTLRWG